MTFVSWSEIFNLFAFFIYRSEISTCFRRNWATSGFWPVFGRWNRQLRSYRNSDIIPNSLLKITHSQIFRSLGQFVKNCRQPALTLFIEKFSIWSSNKVNAKSRIDLKIDPDLLNVDFEQIFVFENFSLERIQLVVEIGGQKETNLAPVKHGVRKIKFQNFEFELEMFPAVGDFAIEKIQNRLESSLF